LPDVTQQENESEYDQEDDQTGPEEDYEDYQENGMQDNKKK
jgi:hypothetical protein